MLPPGPSGSGDTSERMRKNGTSHMHLQLAGGKIPQSTELLHKRL
jgi:hypothetical protein